MDKSVRLAKKQIDIASIWLAIALEKCFTTATALPAMPAHSTQTGSADASSKEEVGMVNLTIVDDVVGTRRVEKSGITFINLGKPYPDQTCTIVIFDKDRGNFSYKPEEYLRGKRIKVKGVLKDYKGRDEIIVTSEKQIEILK